MVTTPNRDQPRYCTRITAGSVKALQAGGLENP